ncbi:type II secretion system GspH family protein [Rossellomorea vietnamensis]|uniref:type II secretion system protein n=1 Tax=Rossellomorea vietnamensis TaxID=218284 RepID=UPI001CCBB708|nr:type II secretion system protein [Rossellomorea vietnamensis]MCA0147427.1 type II secretion system GspH family protein [Rossellomorea vietnamensis]
MLKKMRKMLKNERGLTLVELLAVIVILGIIAAIAVPSIGAVIKNSKDDAKVAEALQIIDAARLAHAEHPDQTKWTHTGVEGSSSLNGYVSKVKDKGYTVTFADGKFTISNHEASDTAISEDDLADEVDN